MKFVSRLEHSKLDVSLRIPPQHLHPRDSALARLRVCDDPVKQLQIYVIDSWAIRKSEAVELKRNQHAFAAIYTKIWHRHMPSTLKIIFSKKNMKDIIYKDHEIRKCTCSLLSMKADTTVPSTNTHQVWLHCASLYKSLASSLYVLSSEALKSLARARLPSPPYWSRPWFLAPRFYSDTSWHPAWHFEHRRIYKRPVIMKQRVSLEMQQTWPAWLQGILPAPATCFGPTPTTIAAELKLLHSECQVYCHCVNYWDVFEK